MVVQAGVIFAKVAPAANARKAGVSPAMVVQALVIFAKVAPVANAWRAGVSPASVVHALVFYCARGYYHRLAFRRRDACAPRLRSVTPFSEENYHRRAFRRRGRLLSRLRSVTPFSEENYHRRAFRRRGRLRSLQSKAPSAVARLRSVPLLLRKLPPPNVSQARRLRSLRSKAPSAMAMLAQRSPNLLPRLRCVPQAVDWQCCAQADAKITFDDGCVESVEL